MQLKIHPHRHHHFDRHHHQQQPSIQLMSHQQGPSKHQTEKKLQNHLLKLRELLEPMFQTQ
jgi:hypothetical protein